jgi:hypothetical protein
VVTQPGVGGDPGLAIASALGGRGDYRGPLAAGGGLWAATSVLSEELVSLRRDSRRRARAPDYHALRGRAILSYHGPKLIDGPHTADLQNRLRWVARNPSRRWQGRRPERTNPPRVSDRQRQK